jgi:steroid 5-alpha reductase family enzyme
MVNHFHLFGLEQVYRHAKGEVMENPKFRTPGLYQYVRHPIYFGLIVAFWVGTSPAFVLSTRTP